MCFFGMGYASAGGRELEVTAFEDLGIAHGVFAEVGACVRYMDGINRPKDILLKFSGDDV